VDKKVAEEIIRLAKERKAILLAHNYQPPEIQDIAHMTGDSLELSMRAAKTDAEVIVFCGVHFMAETASIVSPDKTVLIPRKDAGCPMADMIWPKALEEKLSRLGPMPVVTYVNSTAAVKARSTICCTSANVIAVVDSLAENELLMTPDRNLAQYAKSKTDKKIHFWDGYCPIHDRLTAKEVREARAAHPDGLFMAHPECRPDVLALSDAVLSTSGMLRYARESKAQSFIVGTEEGLLYPLQRANPDKHFYSVSGTMLCQDMKKTTLGDVLKSLQSMTHEVKVAEDIRVKAVKSVERMLAIPKG
jgi:quinolinate synthase